jgi:D-alanine-D-alanine ligase
MAKHTHIGILRGGPSTEYELSIKSGHAAQIALEDVCTVHDIFIDKKGVWHKQGVAMTPERAMHGMEVVYNALHGTYGEDGTVQKILTSLGVQFSGSDAFASALTIDRAKAKETLKKVPGIRMPEHHVVSHYEGMHYGEKSREIFNFFGPPYMVKALHGGTHGHTRIAKTVHDLPKAIHHVATATGDDVLVEQFEKGIHVSCTAINQFRNKKIYTTVPAEEYFTDGMHMSAAAPAKIPAQKKKVIEEATEFIHEKLGLTHASESHFIVTERHIFFLSVGTSPVLSTASPLAVSLEAVGSSMKEYLEHILKIAETTKRYA